MHATQTRAVWEPALQRAPVPGFSISPGSAPVRLYVSNVSLLAGTSRQRRLMARSSNRDRVDDSSTIALSHDTGALSSIEDAVYPRSSAEAGVECSRESSPLPPHSIESHHMHAIRDVHQPVAWLGLTVCLAGCVSTLAGCDDSKSSESSSDPASPESNEQATFQAEEVTFQYERTARLFERIRQRLREVGAPGQHASPERVERYRRESWCTPTIAPVTCRTGGEVTGRPTGWARATLTAVYPSKEADRARGWTYLYEDRRVPEKTRSGWGIRFWLSYRARRVAGNELRIELFHIDEGDVVDTIRLGNAYHYKVAQTRVAVSAPLDETSSDDEPEELRRLESELSRLLASPQQFRTTVTARLEQLQRRVERAIEQGEVGMCRRDAGASGDEGCAEVPLDEQARDVWLDRARKRLERHRRLVQKHETRLHEMLLRALTRETWSSSVDGEP